MIHSYIEPSPLPPCSSFSFTFFILFSPLLHLPAPLFLIVSLSLSFSLVNQTTSGDRSCRFPTRQRGANIHPKELCIAVTPDDIMTTWKLINSFIQPKLLLLFISVTGPHPSFYLAFSSSPICHKFILLHLTSLLVLELPINHCCCLTLSIFPETQGGCCRNWVRHNLQGSRA